MLLRGNGSLILPEPPPPRQAQEAGAQEPDRPGGKRHGAQAVAESQGRQLAGGDIMVIVPHTIQFGLIWTVGSMIACLPSINYYKIACGLVSGGEVNAKQI